MVAAALLCALPPAAASAATATRLAAQLDDAPETGTPVPAIDVRTARLTQVDRSLRFSVSTSPAPATLSNGAVICARFGPPAPITLCARRRSDGWHLNTAQGEVGMATARSDGWLVGTVPLLDLGLRAGPTSWWVTADPRTCPSGTAAGGCGDRVPATLTRVPLTLWQPLATGCSEPGPAQPVTSGPTAEGLRVALTFDDGPSAYTAQVQAVLRSRHVPATFFTIGQRVPGMEPTLRSLLADGDELGNHTWTHATLSEGGPAATDELSRTNAAITAATGFTPCLFRPPHGSVGADLVPRAGALGLATITWSVNSLDDSMPGTDTIRSRVLGAVKPGSIVLHHDGGGDRSQTVAALPAIIDTLKARGYRFVTISQLLGYPTSYVLQSPS